MKEAISDQHQSKPEKPGWFARWLLEPLPRVTDPGQRRKVRLLASFHLTNIALLMLNILRGLRGESHTPIYSLLGQVAAIIFVYVMARAGYIKTSSVITVLFSMVMPYTMLLENPNRPAEPFAWLALSLVLTSALFPWYGTVIVGALAAGSIIAYLNLTPSVMFGDVANVLMLIINLTILTIIFTNHRDRLEAARQLELREVNSQLKKQAEQLNIALEKAKEANRLKSDFLATMSHELRTPLNAIIGFTEIMLAGMGGQIDEDATHMTERIHANSKRQLTLINDVLDLAKIESRRVDIVKKPFSLQAMINGLVSETEVLAKQKNLDYQVKIDPNLPDVLIGDQGHIEQVISNLLSNAFKFTERGHVRLMVSRLDEDRWTINVSDSGVGIPPHALEYIFDPFRQVDSSPERVFQGTGLGLAIVDELVRAMDGTIKVESALGRGSIFVVSLPLDRVTQAEDRKVQA